MFACVLSSGRVLLAARSACRPLHTTECEKRNSGETIGTETSIVRSKNFAQVTRRIQNALSCIDRHDAALRVHQFNTGAATAKKIEDGIIENREMVDSNLKATRAARTPFDI
jgi:hypothetical protein